MASYEFKVWENPKSCFNIVIEKWDFEREIYPLKKPWCLLPHIGEIVKKWHRSLPKHKGEPETWNIYEVPGELAYYIEYVYTGGPIIPGSDFAYDRVMEFFSRYWRKSRTMPCNTGRGCWCSLATNGDCPEHY